MSEGMEGNISGVLILVLVVIELARGCYGIRKMPNNDRLINVISLIQDSLLVRPLIAYGCAWLFALWVPAYQGSLSDLPFWPVFIVFLFGQDFLHYWVHRAAHEYPLLWRAHRTHHSASGMSVLMMARLNITWQFIIPANYIGGFAIYLGLEQVFWWWFLLRAVINVLGHSDVRWDLALYNIKLLKPFIWLIERILTTPDAHHAHHGYGPSGKPMGNYAPTVIFWDFVFGTAKLPPPSTGKIGIENDAVLPWYQQLWWLPGEDRA